MDSIHRRSFSSTAPNFPFPAPYINNLSKFTSMSSPVSPVSPTYTTFSAASPISSSSSASFPNEGSPIPDSHFDVIATGMEAVYSPTSGMPFYNTQGEMATTYEGDFEYAMMNWPPEGKKQQQQHHIPSQSIPSNMDRLKTLSSHYMSNTAQSHHQVQVQQPSPPIQSPVPSHPMQQHHHHHISQLNASNDVIFDVDLDDWHPPSTSNMHAQFPPNHSHSQTHSIALAQVYSNQYASSSAPSMPTSSRRQDDLTVYTGVGTYSAPSTHDQSQPPSAVNGHQSHIFDLSAPMNSAQSSHPVFHQNQSLMSPFQVSRSVQQSQHTYYPSPPLSQQQLSPHQQAMQQHQLQQQQIYSTVHPAEVSPTDSCGSSSPMPNYNDMGMAGGSMVGCDPRFVCADQETELKGALGMDMTMHLQGWTGERRASLASIASSFASTDAERDADGEMDAEGDVDEGDNAWGVQGLHAMHGAHVSTNGHIPRDDGEDEMPLKEESESDQHSGDSEEDGEDDGSGEFRISRRRIASASSLPSMYPYPAEGRSLRPRSSRYSPYALYPLASNGYADQHYASSSQSGSHPRRYASASSSSSSSPRTAGNNVALSSSSSSNGRRRPRPVTSLPMPVPVPNLTKKSRGRHVPTASSLEDLRNAASGAGKKKRKEGDTARPHECQVDGCGKVFARGEHLKRHVRSLHTNEKPFLCKYPGCGKRFSRHDNLGQHTRVHKDYNPPDDLTIPDSESE